MEASKQQNETREPSHKSRMDEETVSSGQPESKSAIKTEESANDASIDGQHAPERVDEELEEGELKDDDDDEEDLDEVDGKKTVSSDQSDESDRNERKESVTSRSSSSSGAHESDSSSSKISSRNSINDSKKFNQQARLVTMRAKLLEAKAREIEMKFQKKKPNIATSSPLSAISAVLPSRNLKTTVAKPPINYAENPNPVDLQPDPRKRPKASTSAKNDVKEKSKGSKKTSRKRKKSAHKKKKRAKTSERRELKESPAHLDIAYDNADRQGPKTPPDNQVKTLEDEQVEWPSYLIKMTTTQPPISYSVNPDSVTEANSPERSDSADLNADFNWYYRYFLNSFDMDKSQAQHQASSLIISSGCYGTDKLNRWLEQQGYVKQMDTRDEIPTDTIGDAETNSVQIRTNKPTFTFLKATREVTLPNGKVLPRGTVQKIVSPYPRSERMIPEVRSAHSDFY